MPDDFPEKTGLEKGAKMERIPLVQALMDDIFFLLAIGLGIPFLLYTLWGVVEVFRVPHG